MSLLPADYIKNSMDAYIDKHTTKSQKIYWIVLAFIFIAIVSLPFIYLTLRIPLFNRLSTRNSVRIARKEKEESHLVLLHTRKQLYKDIQKAWYDALSAQEKYLSTQKAVQANAEALRYALEKYHAGRFTVYEYNEIKLKLANSQSEQAQAKYESMLQKKLLDYYEGLPLTHHTHSDML